MSVSDGHGGSKVVIERRADPTARDLRRLVMLNMANAGCTSKQIAKHFRFKSAVYVRNELVKFRKQRAKDDADRQAV